MIIEIQDVLVSSDIITEEFCCDLEACHGQCCIEGDAGAPVTPEEVKEMEAHLDDVWEDLSASAQAVIDKQGVSYVDQEGDLVTSIVGGKDCVFSTKAPLQSIVSSPPSVPPLSGDRNPRGGETICCLCSFEKHYRQKGGSWCKPISCALYPIREKSLPLGGDGRGQRGHMVALNYNFWNICAGARKKGKELHLPIYKFLRGPLIRRFGEDWYNELCTVAKEYIRYINK